MRIWEHGKRSTAELQDHAIAEFDRFGDSRRLGSVTDKGWEAAVPNLGTTQYMSDGSEISGRSAWSFSTNRPYPGYK